MSFLELRGISRSYVSDAGRNDVLHDINLDVEEGEFIAIVGFSGSGKTTLLSIMAGLIQADAGTALLRGRRITQPGPDRGVVFQSYSLLPWLSVIDNVALGVDQVFAHQGRDERMARVRHYIDMVGLSHAAERKPAELSGGMRQRVSVARALATSPDILLLDEPLSALDALTRARLQDEIERIWAADRKTVVLITNDVDEAILLADRIIPLTPGPRATLGPEFKVALPRPRDRTTMNDNPQFKALRAAVTRYLLDIGHARPASSADSKSLPNLKPITTLADQPPKVYQGAARSGITRGYVEFSEVRKQFETPRGPLTVVDGFNLKMPRGEFISLIGHSGCGKSTVLSMMAGLADVSYGGIILDGREVHSAGPDRAVVFQAPSLLPWLTARENVLLGVDRVYPHAKRSEREDIVSYYLSRVGLGDAMHKLSRDLSNGMRQRVGIARAFALSPKLLLLDEPFGMLDSLTRWELQEVLMEVWRKTQVTAICVTHDVDESILLADRVVMMTNGPNARIGHILPIDIPRPRTRELLLKNPRYYDYRREILDFLAHGGGHGAVPSANASAEVTAAPGQRAA